MSKYREIETEFKDETLFVKALQAAGVPFEHSAGQGERLIGYMGDLRDERANYIVRRRHIGLGSNDLGYRVEGGRITAIVSEFDTMCRETTQIRNRVKQEYARAFVQREATRRGYRVEERRDQAGNIQIQLKRVR